MMHAIMIPMQLWIVISVYFANRVAIAKATALAASLIASVFATVQQRKTRVASAMVTGSRA